MFTAQHSRKQRAPPRLPCSGTFPVWVLHTLCCLCEVCWRWHKKKRSSASLGALDSWNSCLSKKYNSAYSARCLQHLARTMLNVKLNGTFHIFRRAPEPTRHQVHLWHFVLEIYILTRSFVKSGKQNKKQFGQIFCLYGKLTDRI